MNRMRTIWYVLLFYLEHLAFAAIIAVLLIFRKTRRRHSLAMALGLTMFVAVFLGIIMPFGRWLIH
jgi:uncharacterized membrane protein YgaE (UPF0421/DUF939 family)